MQAAATAAAASSIEWYDFFIYGTAAALVFPKLFFPAALPPAVAQLAAFSTFAVGFIARPLGGVVFGHLGDRIGRKGALAAALLLMGVATTLIGLAPTYERIGVAAPVLLILLRIAQGLAVGGQWGGAALLAIEHAPAGRRGFYGGFAQLGVPIGVVLANLVFLAMGETLAPAAFLAWGWRIPFLLSVALVGLGFYVHLRLEDTPEFRELAAREAAAAHRRSPLADVLRRHAREVLLAGGSMVACSGCFYLITTYVVAYATASLHAPRTQVLWSVMLGSLAAAPVLMLSAAASDRIGRRGVYLVGAVLTGLWAFPFFQLIDTGAFWPMTLAVAVGLGLMNLMYGPQAALFAELFATEVRYSGASMGYQLASIGGGGFAPMIAASLIVAFGSSTAVSAYMALLCGISFVSVWLMGARAKA